MSVDDTTPILIQSQSQSQSIHQPPNPIPSNPNSKRYFSVKQAYEEGLVDKLVPGYKLNRFRKIAADAMGDRGAFYGAGERPKFRFTRQQGQEGGGGGGAA